jgi:hypothetical protein
MPCQGYSGNPHVDSLNGHIMVTSNYAEPSPGKGQVRGAR